MVLPSPARKTSQPIRPWEYQTWASDVVETSHNEALFAFGELAIFTLLWRPFDFDAGLVARCSRCFGGTASRHAAAFGQPTQNECPVCFGTTFEGGVRAQILRPTIFADRNDETRDEARGTVTSDTLQMETTADFTMNKGDVVIRFDNTRWQAEAKGENVIRDGFGPVQTKDGFSGLTTIRLDDPTTVSYLIPPTDPDFIKTLLSTFGGSLMPDLNLFSYVAPNGYVQEGQSLTETGYGLGAVQMGHGVPADLDEGVIYLDIDTGILYTGTP